MIIVVVNIFMYSDVHIAALIDCDGSIHNDRKMAVVAKNKPKRRVKVRMEKDEAYSKTQSEGKNGEKTKDF